MIARQIAIGMGLAGRLRKCYPGAVVDYGQLQFGNLPVQAWQYMAIATPSRSPWRRLCLNTYRLIWGFEVGAPSTTLAEAFRGAAEALRQAPIEKCRAALDFAGAYEWIAEQLLRNTPATQSAPFAQAYNPPSELNPFARPMMQQMIEATKELSTSKHPPSLPNQWMARLVDSAMLWDKGIARLIQRWLSREMAGEVHLSLPSSDNKWRERASEREFDAWAEAKNGDHNYNARLLELDWDIDRSIPSGAVELPAEEKYQISGRDRIQVIFWGYAAPPMRLQASFNRRIRTSDYGWPFKVVLQRRTGFLPWLRRELPVCESIYPRKQIPLRGFEHDQPLWMRVWAVYEDPTGIRETNRLCIPLQRTQTAVIERPGTSGVSSYCQEGGVGHGARNEK